MWISVECLRKLTNDSDNEALLLPFIDDILEAITRLLCTQDREEEENKDEGANGGSDDLQREESEDRESDVAELKGAVLSVLLNLVKFSSKTAARLPAHPTLMRRLFGLIICHTETAEEDEASEEEGEGEEEGDADAEMDVEHIDVEEGVSAMVEQPQEETGKAVTETGINGTAERGDGLSTEGRGQEEATAAASAVRGDGDGNGMEGERTAKRRKLIDGESGPQEVTAMTTAGTGTIAPLEAPPTESQASNERTTRKGEEEGKPKESSSPPSLLDREQEGGGNPEPKASGTTTETTQGEREMAVDEGGNEEGKERDQAAGKRKAGGSKGAQVVERARERMRKQAGLVLSKLADDPSCCDALRVYDGVIVQAMLLAPQGPLAALMHKLLLNIGTSA